MVKRGKGDRNQRLGPECTRRGRKKGAESKLVTIITEASFCLVRAEMSSRSMERYGFELPEITCESVRIFFSHLFDDYGHREARLRYA